MPPETPANAPAAQPRSRRPAVLWMLAALAFVVGAGVFVSRGLAPALWTASDDFRVIYGSSRAWLKGVNPYDAEAIDPLWLAADGPAEQRPSLRTSRDLLYPPPTFVLVAPVAALDWPAARTAWALVNLAAVAVSLHAMVGLLGLRWTHPGTWVFIGAALAFAPWITGIKMGQTAVVLAALIVSGHSLRVSGRPVLGGILLGLAAVFKPQIGLVFVAYEVFRWRWRMAGPALAVAALVAVIGIGRLEAAGIPWAGSLSANVAAFTTGEGAGNPLPENPLRFQMVDLRPIVHNFTGNRTLGMLGAIALAGALALAALPAWLRRQEDGRELLALSIGAVLSLLIVYHRFYDAAILVIPLGWVAWALATPEGRRFGWTRWAVLLGLLPFFVPGAAALHVLEQRGRLPGSLTGNMLWDTFILHHQAWALVWLAVALGLALRRCPPRAGPAFAWMRRSTPG